MTQGDFFLYISFDRVDKQSNMAGIYEMCLWWFEIRYGMPMSRILHIQEKMIQQSRDI